MASALRSLGISLIAAMAIARPLILEAQQPVKWQPLGWFYYDEVTGQRDSVSKFARKLEFDTYLLRTDYRTDRTTTTGSHWRSAYLMAQIDCGKRTMQLIRTDFYTKDSTFVDTSPTGVSPVLTMAMIEKADGWIAFYNFACTMQKQP